MPRPALTLDEVDAIAATAGPGLIGGVMVGLTTAKALALAAGKPLIAVNHLAGHALTARLTHGVEFPFLLLLVSGGHCQLLAVDGRRGFPALRHHHRRCGGRGLRQDRQDAGPALSRRPAMWNSRPRAAIPRAYALPRPLLGPRRHGFFLFRPEDRGAPVDAHEWQVNVEDACASFQAAVIDILRDRTRAGAWRCSAGFSGCGAAHTGGGGRRRRQSAIGAALERLGGKPRLRDPRAAPQYCTDNAAMIAWAGLERFALGKRDPLDFSPRARWPLDASGERRHGGEMPGRRIER